MQNNFWGIKHTERDSNVQRRPSENYFQIKTVVYKISHTSKKDVILPRLSY